VPASNAFTQLRRLCSTHPISLAAAATLLPSFTRLTARSLSSAVYSYFGIFYIIVSTVTDSLRYPWKTNFRGYLRLLRSPEDHRKRLVHLYDHRIAWKPAHKKHQSKHSKAVYLEHPKDSKTCANCPRPEKQPNPSEV
jgi:hypothetical protein